MKKEQLKRGNEIQNEFIRLSNAVSQAKKQDYLRDYECSYEAKEFNDLLAEINERVRAIAIDEMNKRITALEKEFEAL